MKRHKITMQQDQSDCGVACLYSLVEYHGGYVTLDTLRKYSGTNSFGTSLLGLYQAASMVGFDAGSYKAGIEALKTQSRPSILHIVLENTRFHYVVCFGTTRRNGGLKFIIGDPGRGILYMDPEELDSLWRSKALLSVEPNDSFVKAAIIRKEKKSWILKFLRDDRALLAVSVVLGIVISILGLSLAFFSQRLIDDFLPKRNLVKLNIGIAALAALLLAKEGLNGIRQFLLINQSRNFNLRIVDFFYGHLLNLTKAFFDSRRIGELTARLNDSFRIQKVISQIVGSAISDSFIILSTVAFLFYYSTTIGLACIAVLPVFAVLVLRFQKSISRSQRDAMNDYSRTEANYISTLQGIDVIKVGNKQQTFAQENNRLNAKLQNSVFSVSRIQIPLAFIGNGFAALFLVSVLGYCSYEVLHSRMKIGELIAVLSLSGALFPGVANLALLAVPINEARIAFDRMFEFSGAACEGSAGETEWDIGSLEAKNISFRFPGGSQVLKNISFFVRKGELITIAGENGCGKSTLSQLLQRFYPVEDGRIITDGGKSIEDISLHFWRSSIGVVPQTIHIFNATVLENIAFEDAAAKPQEVLLFIQSSGFAPVVEKLPQGYLTFIGEEGIKLSGGQKQIIGLLRALYRKPKVLILDEPTSALDRETEQEVWRKLQVLKATMAVILITHQFKGIKSIADRIYLIEGGMISAAGSHGELMNTHNLYSQYWRDLVNESSTARGASLIQ